MASSDSGSDLTPLTPESLRRVAAGVAARLRVSGHDDAASLLDGAVQRAGSPVEEVLTMREALVRTRPHWEELGGAVRREASAALAGAKRLSISL